MIKLLVSRWWLIIDIETIIIFVSKCHLNGHDDIAVRHKLSYLTDNKYKIYITKRTDICQVLVLTTVYTKIKAKQSRKRYTICNT